MTLWLLHCSSDVLPLSYRRLVGAKAIKLGSWDKHPAYCYDWNVDQWYVIDWKIRLSFVLVDCSPDSWGILCWIRWISLLTKTLAEKGVSSWIDNQSEQRSSGGITANQEMCALRELMNHSVIYELESSRHWKYRIRPGRNACVAV